MVVVKLVTTVIPLHIHLAAACMVADWVGIQLLLAMSSRREPEHVLSETLVQHALTAERRLRKPAIQITISLISYAIVGYIVFISIWGTSKLSKNFKSWSWTIQGSYLAAIFCQILTFPFIWGFRIFKRRLPKGHTVAPPENSHVERPEIPKPQQGVFFWGTITVALIVFICIMGVSAHLATLWQRHSRACQDCPQLKATCLPDMMMKIFQSWVPFALPTTFFYSGLLRNWQWGLVVFLMWNLIVTAVVFVGVLIRYDAEGTYKPAWLDWLG
ncbi:hypothetical protein QQX98_001329 [Neonectria punicea]|uniref:Uncharacterized protein n=1 Tax=Neonectria punicea TaxID=979145 RepID=A0ABR1HPE6_9HYPO